MSKIGVFVRKIAYKNLSERSIRAFSSANVSKTALFDLHNQHGGKIVDFGGFLLPVVYAADSITASHLHTRRHCSIFDVSHMLQIKIHGRDRFELIEKLTTADVKGLPADKAALTVFTRNDNGGILDDLIVTNSSEGYLYVVSNAGRRDHDSQLLLKAQEQMRAEKKDVIVELLETSDVSLVAVQGPKAAATLKELTKSPINKLPFMSSTLTTIGGIEGCRVSRCGYTGEDGYEVSVPNSSVTSFVSSLLESKATDVRLAGLGARDSLRLEAGLCLYGSDIDENKTPVEASLTWLIPKSRRARKDFPGADVILKQLKDGPTNKRIGLQLAGGPPARHGSTILSDTGETIGEVTSGGPSPSLGYSIAMGYINSQYSKVGTQVQVKVRGKVNNATVVKMPFLPTNYYIS